MKGICIYCGQNETTRRGDHVPPQCLFGQGRSHSLIQVPCCPICNENFSRDDERARNLLTSLDVTEDHPLIETQLRDKRNRSLVKTKADGTVTDANLRHMLDSSSLKQRLSPTGEDLGTGLALNFDQPVIHRFLERIARALHHHTYDTGFLSCTVQTGNDFGEGLEQIIRAIGTTSQQSFGDNVFEYWEHTIDPNRFSLWVMRFFGGARLHTTLWFQLPDRRR